MEVQGTIKMIDETKSFGSNGFRKREIVVTTDEQYPQHIMIEFTQDKCDLLNNYRLGEMVKIAINLRGREWVNPQGETKYFNSIQGWRIERVGQASPPQQQQPAGGGYTGTGSAVEDYNNRQQTQTNPQQAPGANYREEEHDDLPF